MKYRVRLIPFDAYYIESYLVSHDIQYEDILLGDDGVEAIEVILITDMSEEEVLRLPDVARIINASEE